MPEKPTTAAGYRSEHLALVRATCLFIATKLGDLMDDLVVVGGLVPSLLIDQEAGGTALEPHAGTMDLDIGLAAALLDRGRYREISERLRRSGFAQDENETGNPTRQRWKFEAQERVTIDFLMPPTSPDDRGGSLRDLEPDFAAVIAPGLHLAFRNRIRLSLSGQTILGEDATGNLLSGRGLRAGGHRGRTCQRIGSGKAPRVALGLLVSVESGLRRRWTGSKQRAARRARPAIGHSRRLSDGGR